MLFLLAVLIIVVILVLIVGLGIILAARILKFIIRPKVETSEIKRLYSKMKKARKKEDWVKASVLQKKLDELIR